jgi:dipeptidyl aminopeptidase/acylaminoacyl peptidase
VAGRVRREARASLYRPLTVSEALAAITPGIKARLALLALLPLLALGSDRGAISSVRGDGLIAVTGRNGISLIDPVSSRGRLVLWSAAVSGTTWSPDRRLLAFSVSADYGFMSSVYTVRTDGSGLTLVLRNASEPSWSPDGTQLAVVREGSDYSTDLFVVGADGRDVRKLTSAEYVDSPAWSPDGKWIAVNADDGAGNYGIQLVQADGAKTLSVPDSSDGWAFAWSPDGSSLAFIGSDAIYRVRLPFGRPERLTRGTDLEGLAWSPDVATRRLTVLTGRIPGWAPVWSPDGRELAFLAGPEPGGRGHVHANDLWIVNADGSDPRIVAALDKNESPVFWARAAPGSPSPQDASKPPPASQ